VVDQERIENLPLNGRNPTQLMTLVAGVLSDRTVSDVRRDVPGNSARVVASGDARRHDELCARRAVEQRPLQQRADPMPNPDALQEFSVQTNSSSAEYGRNVGAIVKR